MNKVYLIGTLTRDPELRSTQSGVDVCNFSIAVNRRFKDGNGNQQTDFFNIIAWRQLAGLCNKYLAKGRKVAISGSIQTRTYEAQDGSKRSVFDIVADEVEFLSAAHGSEDQDDAYERQERAAIRNEPPASGYKPPVPPPPHGYQTAVNKPTPAYAPQDSGFTQVDDDELPF